MVIPSLRSISLVSALACAAALAAGCGQPEVTPDKAAPLGGAPVESQVVDSKQDAECDLASVEDWSACVDRPSILTGRLAVQVSQHPVIAAPFGPDGEGPGQQQVYVDVEGKGQIIVVTASDPVQCEGQVSVRGVLQSVDLGGEEGTKESYKGWSVQGATITCLK